MMRWRWWSGGGRCWLLLMCIVMTALTAVVGNVVDCICDKRDCEPMEPSGCPGKGVKIWDACKCCEICARTLGEKCGEFDGTCDPIYPCLNGICRCQDGSTETCAPPEIWNIRK